ncbi:MAG TPA: lantibiotic dehydratase, partial [Kofleriaceae bacterium]
PRDHHVEVGPTRSWRPRDHVHLAGDLYVERTPAGLRVRSRVRELDHDIISFTEPYLLADTSPHFKLLPKRPHLPRVTIDKLVFSRERWNLEAAAFRQLTEPGTEADLIRRVNAWARGLGMPRYVFVTVPHEPKPFYVDFSSPILVDNFLRLLPKAPTLGVSEMLPGHDGLWLPDAAGQRYSCELRVAAVDPVRWSPPAGSPEERG